MQELTKKAITGLIWLQIIMALMLFAPTWTLHFWEARSRNRTTLPSFAHSSGTRYSRQCASRGQLLHRLSRSAGEQVDSPEPFRLSQIRRPNPRLYQELRSIQTTWYFCAHELARFHSDDLVLKGHVRKHFCKFTTLTRKRILRGYEAANS